MFFRCSSTMPSSYLSHKVTASLLGFGYGFGSVSTADSTVTAIRQLRVLTIEQRIDRTLECLHCIIIKAVLLCSIALSAAIFAMSNCCKWFSTITLCNQRTKLFFHCFFLLIGSFSKSY